MPADRTHPASPAQLAPLLQLQSEFRAMMVTGAALPDPGLRGGANPMARLGIFRRHYRTSLAKAIVASFPGCAWLVGSEALTASALAYVEAEPPTSPVIAEYGGGFPAFLGARLADKAPYAGDFAALEWRVGRASLAVDRPALAVSVLAGREPEAVMALRLTLQPGLSLIDVDWPVDRLMAVFLGRAQTAGAQFGPKAGTIEIWGARGQFGFAPREAATATFRRALMDGATIAAACEAALAVEACFEPGVALAALFEARLVTGFLAEDRL